jgi:hypothetical protein
MGIDATVATRRAPMEVAAVENFILLSWKLKSVASVRQLKGRYEEFLIVVSGFVRRKVSCKQEG